MPSGLVVEGLANTESGAPQPTQATLTGTERNGGALELEPAGNLDVKSTILLLPPNLFLVVIIILAKEPSQFHFSSFIIYVSLSSLPPSLPPHLSLCL